MRYRIGEFASLGGGFCEDAAVLTVSGRNAYELKELPSVTVASAYCESGDDAAEHAYDALRRWMHVQDYRPVGPKRVIHLGRMLAIQFPLRSP